jgi:hypothetical protein
MNVYIVASIGCDDESGETVGYNPIKGFTDIEVARQFALDQLADWMRRFSDAKFDWREDDGILALSFTYSREIVRRADHNLMTLTTELVNERYGDMYAVLTVEVEGL